MPARNTRRSIFSAMLSFFSVQLGRAAEASRQPLKFLDRGFFQRLLGNCATPEPRDAGCWSYAGGRVTLARAQAPELNARGSAIRLEGKGLPQRVLVFHAEDDSYHAFKNTCTHMGRRLDAVPGTRTTQCCSVGKSTFDYTGKVLYGPARDPIKPFRVEATDRILTIWLA